MELTDQYKGKNIEELNQLIEIAEKTSESARQYTEKINRIYLLLFLTLFILFGTIGGLLYFNFNRLPNEYQFILLIFLVGLFMFSIAIILLQILRYRKQLLVEENILSRLLDMIFELLEFYTNKGFLSNIEIAIFEMRLQRVKFNFRNRR